MFLISVCKFQFQCHCQLIFIVQRTSFVFGKPDQICICRISVENLIVNPFCFNSGAQSRNNTSGCNKSARSKKEIGQIVFYFISLSYYIMLVQPFTQIRIYVRYFVQASNEFPSQNSVSFLLSVACLESIRSGLTSSLHLAYLFILTNQINVLYK